MISKNEIENAIEKENKKIRLGYWTLEEDNNNWKWIIDKEKLINEIIEGIYKRK